MSKMYSLINEHDDESYRHVFDDETEARHWVINHLDLSKNWSIKTL